jgi:hypothetical protein
MISSEDQPSTEQVQEQIKDALTQEEIDPNLQLLEKWKHLPSDIKDSIANAVASALTLLPEERKAQAKRKNRARARKWYWKERKTIEGLLEQIARSAVVSKGPGKEPIEFYLLDDLLCPHGWNWSHCEGLGKMLISLTEATSDSNRDYLLRELKKADIDPAQARLGEDVCAPGTRDKGSPSQCSAPPPGRPPKILEKLLLQTIVLCLKSAHWTDEESFGFLAAILIYCFGRKPKAPSTLALALGRQWRSLKSSKVPS